MTALIFAAQMFRFLIHRPGQILRQFSARNFVALSLPCLVLLIPLVQACASSDDSLLPKTGNSTSSLTADIRYQLEAELAYWSVVQPLIERAALDGGTPLATFMIDNQQALLHGDEDAWVRYVSTVKLASEVYRSTLSELIVTQPGGSASARALQTGYADAWKTRLLAFDVLVAGWETSDDGLFDSGLDALEDPHLLELGRHSEDTMVEFASHLLEQCESHHCVLPAGVSLSTVGAATNTEIEGERPGTEQRSQGSVEEDDPLTRGNLDAEAYYDLGNTFADLGQHERALEYYGEAIRLAPRHPFSYIARGTSFLSLGQYDHAMQDLDEAIRLNPKQPFGHITKGMAYTDSGLYDQAIQEFSVAIGLDPQSIYGSLALAYFGRAAAYGNLVQHELAIRDYDESIRIDPQYAQAYYNRGIHHEANGRSVLVDRDFTRAKELGYEGP